MTAFGADSDDRVADDGSRGKAGPTFRSRGFSAILGLRRRMFHGRRDFVARLGDLLAIERDRGAAFLLLPVMFGIGALAYFSAAVEPGWLLLSAFAALALAAWLRARRELVRVATCAVLVSGCGMLAAKFETWRMSTPMLGAEIGTVVTGRVLQVDERADGRVRLTVRVLSTERPTLRFAPDRIRVSTREAPDLAPGDGVEGVVRLMPPSGPPRPGGYDFAFESFMDGVGAVGFFLTPPRKVEVAEPPSLAERAAAAAAAMRGAIAERIRSRIGGAEGEIAAALVAGVRAGIPEEVNEVLRRTGLAHVLSISGLHMALVAGTVMFTLRASLALAPGFASRRPIRKYAALAALAAATYYLVVSGAAVAAQRSYVMIAVMLVALLFDRAAVTMRNLAIAALIVLFLAPHEAAGPSFQMSFAATAALIAAYGWWSERSANVNGVPPADRGPVRKALRTLVVYGVGLAATSVVAGLATTAFGVWHFHRVAPLGVIANLGAMPVVSAVVMPSAVAAGLLMPFGLEGPALDLMGWGIGVMIAVAAWVAERSPADAVGMVPVSAILLLTTALVLATLATTALRWSALPFLIAGLAVALHRDLPEALVSEDGRLVAIRRADGDLAANRSRPNAFTVEMWRDAMAAGKIVPPMRADAAGADERFVCVEGSCVFTRADGAIVAHADDASAARGHCAGAALIVIADATAVNPCRAGEALVITGRDLARRGSAEIFLPQGGRGRRATARFAISEPFRPWTAHRAFSRAARGLQPWRRAEPASSPPTAAGAAE